MDSIAHPGFAPISLAIPGGISPNRCIIIDGEVPKEAKSFSARLQCGQSIKEKEDIAMSLKFFFDDEATRFSVNSYLLNEWGTPEGTQLKDQDEKNKKEVQAKGSSEVLLRPGDRCNLVIECHDTDFSIHVQSKHLYDFIHRTDYAHISYLVVIDDFLVNQVGVVGGDGPMRWIVHEHVTETWEPPITTLTDYNFATSILNSSQMWLVLFYLHPSGVRAPWCEAARHADVRNIRFGVLDSLVNLDTVTLLGIRTCPTILHFPQGIKTPQTFEKYSGEYTARGFVLWALHRYRRETGQPPSFGSPLPPVSRPVHLVRAMTENNVRFETEKEFGEHSIWHEWARREGLVVVDKAVGDDVGEDLVAIINIDQQKEKTQETITDKNEETKRESVNRMIRDNVIVSIAGPKAVEEAELTRESGKELVENESNETDLTENELPEKELAQLTAKEMAELYEQGVGATGAQIDKELEVEEKIKPKALKFEEKAVEVDTKESVETEQDLDYKIIGAPKEFFKRLLGSNVEINKQREDEMRRFITQQEGKVSQKDSKGMKSNSNLANASIIGGGTNKIPAEEDKKKLEISKKEKSEHKLVANPIKSPTGSQKMKSKSDQRQPIGQMELLDKIIERLSKPDPPNQDQTKLQEQKRISSAKVSKESSKVSRDSLKVSREPSKSSQEGTKPKSREESLKPSRKTSKTSIKHSPKSSLKTLPKDARDQRTTQPVSSDKPQEQTDPNAPISVFGQLMKRLTTPVPSKVTQGPPKVIEDETKKKPTQEGSTVSKQPSKTSIKLSPKGSLKMLPPKDLSNQHGSQTLASLTKLLEEGNRSDNVQQGVLEQVSEHLSRQVSAKNTREAVTVAQDSSKVSQDSAKIDQDATKDTQNAAKVSQDTTEVTEDAAKVIIDTAKIDQDAAKNTQNTAKVNQDTPKNNEDTTKIDKDILQDTQNTAKVKETKKSQDESLKTSRKTSKTSLTSQKTSKTSIPSQKTSKTSIKTSPKDSLKTTKDLKDQQNMQTLATIAKLPGDISQKISNIVGRTSVKESIKSLSQKEENYADITQKLTNTKPINVIDGKDAISEVIAHSDINSLASLTKLDVKNIGRIEEKVLDVQMPNTKPTIATAGKGGSKTSPKESRTKLYEEEKLTSKRPSEKSSGILKSPKTSTTNVTQKEQRPKVEISKDESIQNVSSTKSTNLNYENNSLKTNVDLSAAPSQTEKKDVKMEKVSTKSSLKRLPQREEKHPQITQKASNVKFVEDNVSGRDITYNKTGKTQSGSTVKLFQGEGSANEPSEMQIDPSKNMIASQSRGTLIKEPQGSQDRISKGSASDPGEIYEEVEMGSQQALQRSFFESMMSMEWADRMHYAASDIRRLVNYSGCNYL